MSRMEYDRALTDAAGGRGDDCVPPLLWFLGKPWTAPQFPVISMLSPYFRAVKRKNRRCYSFKLNLQAQRENYSSPSAL